MAGAVTAAGAAAQRRLGTRLGLSRLTDSTRLDRLGWPVCAAIRPRGLTLRVHAGKGPTLAQARLGALMEACEYAAAEAASARGPDGHSPAAELQAGWSGRLDWSDFAPRLGARLRLDRPLGWCRCTPVGAPGATVAVPAERVLLPWTDPDQPGVFGCSSHGLAAAFSHADAVRRALLEVLERDTVAMHRGRDASRWVEPDSLPAPWRRRLARWQAQGVELLLRELPNAFGLPAFEAVLFEPASGDVRLASGSGLHPDAGQALERAIGEAAQSRLSAIHGGRDDLTDFYDRPRGEAPAVAAEQALLARLRDTARRVRFDAIPSAPEAGLPPAAALEQLAARLRARGFPQVLVRPFDLDDGTLARHGVHVVRVVVPGCELPPEGEGPPRIGRRLMARIVGDG